MENTQKRQAVVIRRAVKLKNSENRKALAKHLNWYRKNKKQIAF